MSSIDGLASGLDTTSIISQLMRVERLPQTLLGQRKIKDESISSSLTTVRSSVLALRDLARKFTTPLTWQSLSATSSSDAVTVAARTGRTTGAVKVTVQQTASAASIYSETVASLDTIIAPGGSAFSYGDSTPLGIDSIRGNGIPFGDTALTVVKATAPARVTAPTAPPLLPVVWTSSKKLDVKFDGISKTITMAAGTYTTTEQLRGAIEAGINANPDTAGKLTASVSSDGRLELSSIREGSATTLEIRGGDGRAALGFIVTSAVTGTDGIIEVGPDRIATTITDSTPGTLFTLGAGTGSLEITMGGPLRTGSVTITHGSYGTGSLRDVVDSINSANGLGYTAAAVNVGNGYRLQLTATKTGAGSTVDIDRSQFTGFSDPQNAFTTLTTGRDAILTVQGDNPYQVTSSTNTFTDLLPGLDLTVQRATTEPVTISVNRNHEAAVDKVAELVDALNAALKGIAAETAFNPVTGKGSTLTGNSAVRRATQELTRALADPVVGGAFASAGQIGLNLNRDGTIAFDRAVFTEKLSADPDGVGAMFSTFAGGTNPGIFDRLASAADAATSLSTGYLTTARDAVTQRVAGYTRQIDAYESRMVRREATLRRTYANLELALSGLSSQQSWLTGQLKSLSPQSS